MKKRLLSLFMCFTLVIPYTNIALASTVDSNFNDELNLEDLPILTSSDLTEAQYDTILDNVETLSSYGFSPELLTNIKLDDENSVTSTIDLYGTPTDVQVHNDGDAVTFDFYEDEKHDEVTFAGDTVLYNGNEVIIEDIITDDNENVPEDTTLENVLRSAYIEYTTTICPYGKARDYNYYVGHTVKKNITFLDTIGDMTKAALATILALAIAAELGVNDAALYAILVAVSGALIKDAPNPLSNAVSYEYNTYYYKTGKYRITSSISAKYIDAIIYSEGNLRGHMETAKFYECVDHS